MKPNNSWIRMLLVSFIFLGLISCGSDDGDGNDNNTTPPPPPPPENTQSFDVNLGAKYVVGGSGSDGSATAELTLNLDTDELNGTVELQDITATGVELRTGFAGETGSVVTALESESDTSWAIPADTPLDEAQRANLDAGSLYVLVSTEAMPEGALRGQILPEGIEVITTALSGVQEVPRVQTDATGKAALTIDTEALALNIHVNTMGLDTANAAHIHRGLAGTNGPIAIGLMQDPDNVRHWFAENVELETSDMEDLNNGYYYVNVHSPENPPGEIRGQVPGDNVDIVFTQLTGDDVVPPVTTDNYGILASTISLVEDVATFHLNNIGLDDAMGASLRQAPVGQNGPIAINLTQDTENFGHWFAEDAQLTDDQSTALFNQGLYAIVYTPAFPGGEVRGQIEPEGSSMGSGDNFEVTATNPADGATVDSFPTTVTVTFNAEPATATADQFTLEASGGDSSFGDGNEIEMSIMGVSLDGSTVSLDFTGVMANDDTYQITVSGSGDTALTDTQGRILDGDMDGTAGGDMMSTFTLVAAEPAATLTEIQEAIFTPTCAVSGCHTGGSPAAGQNLSEGQAFDNLVNVPSSQDDSLTRVIPGNPDDSLLVQKVEGTQPIGGRMPLGGTPLSNAQIQMIRDWIEAGAEDN